ASIAGTTPPRADTPSARTSPHRRTRALPDSSKTQCLGQKFLCARMTRMLCHFPRLSVLTILSILLLLSSATPRSLRAQSTAVPLPPSAKLPKPKVDRPGFPPIPKFTDIASKLGLTISHLSTGEKRYIVESMSGGAGLFDCDDDG